jgi:hypothetical protein
MVGAVALCSWLLVQQGETSRRSAENATVIQAATPPRLPESGPFGPVRLTGAELEAAARSLAQPLYWAGPDLGRSYELMRDEDESMIVRYLPKGVAAGDPGPRLSVATIQLPNAYAQTEARSVKPDAVSIRSVDGGLAWYRKARPGTVYLAYPGLDYLIAIEDPAPERARRLIRTGQIRTID